ncbi:hypothetical protein [Sinomonas sp. P47F7]|uniref:hypothetical protein n=1 Tax=Sinomonas sp. P47F7 TaxID=3410987 RepID=UPI003BF55C95
MNEPTSLRDLVELAMRRHDTSGRQLAFLAQKNGFTIAVTTVNHLKAGTYKSTPTAETIRAIAWLAGVSDEVAFTAAGQPVPGPPLADELPPGSDSLPPKARKAVIEMIRVLVDAYKDGADDQDSSTTHPAADALPSAATPSGPDDSPEWTDDVAERRAARRRTRSGQKTPTAVDIDGELPPNWRELAAHRGPTEHLERARELSERGEESQEDAD